MFWEAFIFSGLGVVTALVFWNYSPLKVSFAKILNWISKGKEELYTIEDAEFYFVEKFPQLLSTLLMCNLCMSFWTTLFGFSLVSYCLNLGLCFIIKGICVWPLATYVVLHLLEHNDQPTNSSE